MDVIKAIQALRDVPVSSKKGLVDREKELEKLVWYAKALKGSIIGVCGERGVGKTSLLNVVAEEVKGIRITVMQRENTAHILYDIIQGLEGHLGKKYGQLLKKMELEFGFSLPPSAGVQVKEGEKPVRKVVEELRALLDKEKEVVLIIDELDKEPYEEIVRTIDAIRMAFEGNNTTAIMTLPPVVYERYVRALMEGQELANVEGIFSKVVLLKGLGEKELMEMVKRRGVTALFDKKGLKAAVEFAQGNPRRLITVLRDTLLRVRDKASYGDVMDTIREYVREYVERLPLSEREWELLRLLHTWGREQAAEKAVEEKIVKRKSHFYTYLKRLEEKGMVKEGRPIPPLTFIFKHNLLSHSSHKSHKVTGAL